MGPFHCPNAPRACAHARPRFAHPRAQSCPETLGVAKSPHPTIGFGLSEGTGGGPFFAAISAYPSNSGAHKGFAVCTGYNAIATRAFGSE